MARRQFAANFYAGASDAEISGYLAGFGPPDLGAPPAAGLVPHAGWTYSGAVAAKVFQTIKSRREPETFILRRSSCSGLSIAGSPPTRSIRGARGRRRLGKSG